MALAWTVPSPVIPLKMTRLCVYIFISPISGNSALVITSAQAGKQVVPKSADLGEAEFTWLGSCSASPRVPIPCHHSCCGTSKWLSFLYSQRVIIPNACTLPRVTEVSTDDLSPGQPRWTNRGEPAQIISSLDTFHDTWLKGKAIPLLLVPEPNTWAAVALPVISCSQGMKRSSP